MGSTSDWDVMQHCVQTLEQLGIANERRAISAHRTPDLVIDYCRSADARGLKVIIAAAGGAAHLAGVAAALTQLPAGCRAVFLKFDVEGYKHAEIAELFGCSVGNSKSQLHKARRKLRRLLKLSGHKKAHKARR